MDPMSCHFKWKPRENKEISINIEKHRKWQKNKSTRKEMQKERKHRKVVRMKSRKILEGAVTKKEKIGKTS